MLRESGLVTKVENGLAWVNTENKLSCSSCKVESTCGSGILEKYLAGKVFVSKLDNRLGANVGDKVEIAIPAANVTKAALLAYSVPLLGLILGALLTDRLYEQEVATIIGSVLGLTIGLLITHSYNTKVANKGDYVPKMVSKVSTGYSVNAFNAIKVKNLE